MPNILLASKTAVPKINNHIIERERLTKILQRNDMAKLIVIRAPAGYGKTTMLSSWMNQLDSAVAWYTVDQTDNDPILFWKYLTHSVYSALHHESTSQIRSLLHTQPQLPLENLVDSLLNELFACEKIHIIIDDYHHIENVSIHHMMTRLIDFLPDHCTVYLTSRSSISLPVARWRLSYCMLEMDAKHLLFTYEETNQFYEKQKIQLSITELQNVFAVTEGWATGLQLTSLSTAKNATGEWQVEQLRRNDSNIAQFLMNEVLSKLAPPIQNFLLYTSLLEHVTPDICNLLTNRTDSQQVLLELEKQGFFISRVSTKEQIFKYHNLLKMTLRKELDGKCPQNVIVDLYEKATNALYKNGNFICAIELALNGELYARAEQWIYEHIVAVLSCGHSTSYVTWIRKLLKSGYDVHPEIMVMYAYTLAALHDLEDAYRVIEELEQKHRTNQWMDRAEYTSAVDDFLGVKAYILVMLKGDLAQGGEFIRQRLERKPKKSKWDAIFTQYNQKEHVLFRTNIGYKGKLLSDEKAMSFFIKFRSGEFKELSMTGYSYGMRAEKLYEWNRFDELSTELEEALRSGHQFRDSGLLVPMYILKSKIAALDNQYIVAQAVLDHAIETISERYWINTLRVMKALLFSRENDSIQAEQELAKIKGRSNADSTQVNLPFYLLVKARVYLVKGHYQEAKQLIIQVQLQSEQEGQLSTNIEAAILRAICLVELGDKNEALSVLHHALKLAEPYEYVRTFIDEIKILPLLRNYVEVRHELFDNWDEVSINYAHLLLECAQKHEQVPALEALSVREQEILSLLSAGASNREIAEKLFLSEGTVRVYLSGIYSKLGVKNRAQALLFKQT